MGVLKAGNWRLTDWKVVMQTTHLNVWAAALTLAQQGKQGRGEEGGKKGRNELVVSEWRTEDDERSSSRKEKQASSP